MLSNCFSRIDKKIQNSEQSEIRSKQKGERKQCETNGGSVSVSTLARRISRESFRLTHFASKQWCKCCNSFFTEIRLKTIHWTLFHDFQIRYLDLVSDLHRMVFPHSLCHPSSEEPQEASKCLRPRSHGYLGNALKRAMNGITSRQLLEYIEDIDVMLVSMSVLAISTTSFHSFHVYEDATQKALSRSTQGSSGSRWEDLKILMIFVPIQK